MVRQLPWAQSHGRPVQKKARLRDDRVGSDAGTTSTALAAAAAAAAAAPSPGPNNWGGAGEEMREDDDDWILVEDELHDLALSLTREIHAEARRAAAQKLRTVDASKIQRPTLKSRRIESQAGQVGPPQGPTNNVHTSRLASPAETLGIPVSPVGPGEGANSHLNSDSDGLDLDAPLAGGNIQPDVTLPNDLSYATDSDDLDLDLEAIPNAISVRCKRVPSPQAVSKHERAYRPKRGVVKLGPDMQQPLSAKAEKDRLKSNVSIMFE